MYSLLLFTNHHCPFHSDLPLIIIHLIMGTAISGSRKDPLLDQSISVHDGSDIQNRTLNDVVSDIHDFGTREEHKYNLHVYSRVKVVENNGFKCQIRFSGTCFCGYVLEAPDEYRDRFAILRNNTDVDDIEELYKVHGGFTAGFGGFDCAHYGDIHLNMDKNGDVLYVPIFDEGSSFKSEAFVHLELERFTKSMLDYWNKP